MRANIRRIFNDQEIGDFVLLPGEHKTLTNLVCYGVIPYARLEWGAQAGDKISVHVYFNPDLTRTGKPDKKMSSHWKRRLSAQLAKAIARAEVSSGLESLRSFSFKKSCIAASLAGYRNREIALIGSSDVIAADFRGDFQSPPWHVTSGREPRKRKEWPGRTPVRHRIAPA